MVKILDTASEELPINEKLLQLISNSPNHILPSTIIRSDTPQPFVIMPYVTDLTDSWFRTWDLRMFVHSFRQMVEVRLGNSLMIWPIVIDPLFPHRL